MPCHVIPSHTIPHHTITHHTTSCLPEKPTLRNASLHVQATPRTVHLPSQSFHSIAVQRRCARTGVRSFFNTRFFQQTERLKGCQYGTRRFRKYLIQAKRLSLPEIKRTWYDFSPVAVVDKGKRALENDHTPVPTLSLYLVTIAVYSAGPSIVPIWYAPSQQYRQYTASPGTINPFRTAIPFWGQTSLISSSLSPKRDGGPKRVTSTLSGW